MKTFSELLLIFEQIKGHKSPEEIAKKHGVSLSSITNQLKIGVPIEHEHTKDTDLATDIALQHLGEFPDYYTRLKKMETSAKKGKVNEGTLHHWFKGSKSKDGNPGWVQADGSSCANEAGETKTPKCFSSGRLRALKRKGEKGEALIRSAISRKRQEDPEQQKKTGAAKPVNVKTFAKGKKNKNYVRAEPDLKEFFKLSEATKDIPGKGSGTKDACYYKVKSRFDVWPSAYACVPEHSSKALTRNGWRTVEQLKIGDEILTHNLDKDELEFKPILNLHRYKDVKTNVVRSGNTGFVFECTDNHKWIMNMPYQKGTKFVKYEKMNGMFFMETLDLLEKNTNKRLVVSAPYKGGSPITKDLIYKYGDNWINYILEISEEQRQSWLFSSIIYDGCQQKIQRVKEKPEIVEQKVWDHTSPYNKQTFGFKQKNIEHRDAFLLSAFLNQGLVTWKKDKNKDIYCCHYTSNKRYKNTSNFNLVKERVTDVWCPETENSTWVMSQETDGWGIITITGNSAALVKCRKVGAANWGKKSNKLKEEYTKIQQSGNTYKILVSWKGASRYIQIFFPNFKRPTKEEVNFEANKIYPGSIVLTYKPSKIDPTKPYLFAGELK